MTADATLELEEDGVSVLVADDEEDMRLLLRAFLTRAGVRIAEEAVDGPDALAAFARLHPPPVPSVVVLDQRMPIMSGLEVARELLAQRPEQRIVLFSAHLRPEIEEEAAAIGISACLSKTEIERLPLLISDLAAN